MIKTLSSSSIHRICSSQVITSLAIAVKELVENSLDAGATKIDIFLKNYGKDSIVISDNGTGIDSADHELICKKHATSKLFQFKDLESLSSFGFRGEALSSLSAICGNNLIITTKTIKCIFGYELHYNSEGDLIKTKKIPYNKTSGTSIQLSLLFKTLPVRFKDFTKNIKKEYSHLLSILQSYAIIQTNVCFVVRNNNKIILNTSNNNKCIKNNIGSIFGWKLIQKLHQIDKEKIDLDDDNASVTLNGFVSNQMMEYGRSKSDIQFFYVNKRPVDIKKIQKLINGIYKSNINRHKYPIIILNMTLLTNKYDINVDPNKRTIFIQNEDNLFEKLSLFFQKLYETQNMSYSVKSLDSFISTQKDNNKNNNINNVNNNNKKKKRKRKADKHTDLEPGTKFRRCLDSTKTKIETNYQQDQVSLEINGNEFISAFRALVGLRKVYDDKDKDNNKDMIDYGDDDDNGLDLSLDKMKRVFNKNDCINMDIIGQFNKGFIISKLGNDIFIIDQHASDEKYRFENLMKNHRIKSQSLLIPKRINCLTSQQEIAIMDNVDIFESNGFKFNINKSKNNGERVEIISLPMSLNPQSKISYEFGEDDVLELATLLSENTRFVLTNNNNGIIRPTKVRTVFAYKACRSAIMIGKDLTKKEMRNVVDNICTLDQPWNCPHGRPTMRHLFDLSLLNKHFKDKGQTHRFGPFAFA